MVFVYLPGARTLITVGAESAAMVGAGRADLVIGSLAVEIKANKQAPSEASPQLRGYMDSLRDVEGAECTGIVVNFSQRGGVSVLVLQPQRARAPIVKSRFFRDAETLETFRAGTRRRTP